MDVAIRSAARQDVPTLLRFIHKLAAYEKLAHEVRASEEALAETLFCAQPKAFAVLAEEKGVPLGFALYFFNYSTFLGAHGLYIEDLFVEETARGKGVGMALFRHLAALAMAEGCGRMEWWVLDWNHPAIDFYEKLGASAMNEWTVYRLQRTQLEALMAS